MRTTRFFLAGIFIVLFAYSSISKAEDIDIYSGLSGAAGVELLRPAPDDRLRTWPVSRRVNKTGASDDDSHLIDEVQPGARTV